MRLPDLVAAAWRNLGRRKGRTALTAGGVLVGTCALVLLLSLAQGVRATAFHRLMSEEGTTYIFVIRSKRPIDPSNVMEDVGWEDLMPITNEDLEALRAVGGVAYCAPFLQLTVAARADAERTRSRHLEGIPPEDAAVLERFLIAGRMWTDPNADEVVTTSRVVERLKMGTPRDAVGRTIHIEHPLLEEPVSIPLRVAGVLDANRMGFLRRHHLFVSEQTWWRIEQAAGGGLEIFMFRLNRDAGRYPFAFARAAGAEDAVAAAQRIRAAGFQAITAWDALEGLRRMLVLIEGLLFVLGGIGLLVALFGIANTMSMSVLERTGEIGVMKAVGATDGTVLGLFLAEAALLGLLGGACGVGAGWAVGKVLSAAARALREMPDDVVLFYVPPWLAAAAMAFAVAIGMAAGLVPALRAARMAPAAAVRYE